MLETIEFNGQLGVGAIKIQDVIADRMLATEFETGETPAT